MILVCILIAAVFCAALIWLILLEKENEMPQHPGKGGKQKRPDKKPKK